jgi:transposase
LSAEPPDVLIFQDEMEIHRFPTLTRMWAPIGQQPQVPTPGKNEKKVVYGGVDYATGKLTYTIADTKCGTAFILFLTVLLRTYAGRRIRLVCDNGRFHTTKAVQQFLADHRDQLEIYWLPPYCPSLNLIERLWGHLKRTVLANVLYTSLEDLVQAFRRGVRRVSSRRERMSFMFKHDDVTEPAATPRPLFQLAA